MRKILLIATISLLAGVCQAQYSFQHYNLGTEKITVSQNNKILDNPFSGGFNVPQFNEIDLNFDGIQDLLVFDRDGYRLSTFINKGIANTVAYEYAPQYEKNFPKFTDWMITVDYNGDGKKDIFCAIPGGAKVYKNVGNATEGPKFELKYSELLADYKTFVTRLNISQADFPAILDVDDDGDIDILTFYPAIDTSGEGVYFYQNMGVERYGKADTMDFIVGKQCWGRFRESFTNCDINLNYPIGLCATGGRFTPNYTKEELNNLQKSEGGAHAGSTLLIFDATGDGKKDILIGDLSCTKMYMLVNTNNNQDPIMTQAYKSYPPNHPIDMLTFPAAHLIDANNDGKLDLAVAPNILGNSDNVNNTQLYLNNGSNDVNQFTFSTDAFLENGSIEVGMGSSPVFVDYNNDGKQDMVISNTGYFDSIGVYTTGLALYENIGTKQLASFELITRDWLGFSALNIANMAPDFSDLDNDGDLDMICGSNDGLLHFFRNTAGSGANIDLQYVPNYFGSIDVGNMSTPFVYDFNQDGKKEIIVGERFDNINVFENTGTDLSPVYTLLTDSLWKINTQRMFGYPSGRCKLIVKQVKADDVPRAILSNGNGKVYILGPANIAITTPNKTPIDSIATNTGNFSNANGGFNASMADLNDDGKLEMVVGNPQGGVVLFKNNSTVQGVGIKNETRGLVNLYPNPSSDQVYIEAAGNTIHAVEIFDLQGKLIFDINSNQEKLALDLVQIQAGLYIVKVESSIGIEYIKWSKQ